MSVPDAKETAAHWLAHAKDKADRAQEALDEIDSANLPGQSGPGDMDVVRERSELLRLSGGSVVLRIL